MTDPLQNKGTAYTAEERQAYGLEGLLPPRVESLDEQAARVLHNTRTRASALEKYLYLSAVRDDNETLFFHVLLGHLEELLPVVYTPTVGEACLQWSRIYQRPRGLYISARQHRGRISRLLRQWPRAEVGVIVVTDGGRILGLGDLGANGMGIPIGKLSLYSACAGIHPGAALPILLDVGTDNEQLRCDPMYLGDREARMTGLAYDAMVDEFVEAVCEVFPGTILQLEDFNNSSAFRLLARYRDRLACFDDDVQGTSAMGLAGLYSACRLTGGRLSDHRILFVGAGQACLGIGGLVVAAMQREGTTEAEARKRCLFVDSTGLVVASRSDLAGHKRPFAQDRAPASDLLAIVRDYKPSALIGACGEGGRFTEPVVREMARVNDRPIVFALSNPTQKAECTAEQAYAWTDGRVVFASGSPFSPVSVGGSLRTPAQGNNSFVFPGVGLGLLLSGARRVTDEMFLAAARALSECVSEGDVSLGRVYPSPSRMREVAVLVSAAVARVAYGQGHATRPQPPDRAAETGRAMYVPRYT